VQTALLIVGALSEFAGIVMIAFPDFVPGARKLSAWIGHRARAVENRLRRLLRRPQRVQAHSVAGEGSVAVGGSVSGIVGVNPDATPEEKLEYLLRRDQDAQRRVNELDRRVGELAKKMPRELAELRQSMQAHVAQELIVAAEAYRPLRIAGTVALAIGLVCVTTANFV
jgi:hypothetical protein